MENITEIVSGCSTYFTIKNSKLTENEIIKFDNYFSVAELSSINEFILHIPKYISEELATYNFSE